MSPTAQNSEDLVGSSPGHMPQLNFSDLESKGFLVLKDFLSATDCQKLVRYYESLPPFKTGNYALLTRMDDQDYEDFLSPKVNPILSRISKATNIDVDTFLIGLFFDTIGGKTNYVWHQDHETRLLYREHYQNINFYIPLVKEDPRRTGLKLLPFDQLEQFQPGSTAQLIGQGSSHLECHDGIWSVMNFDLGRRTVTFDGDPTKLAVAPEIGPGDLLMMRGDVFHATQDIETRRIALSLRLISGQTKINVNELVPKNPDAFYLMLNNYSEFLRALDCFFDAETDEMPLSRLIEHMKRMRADEIKNQASLA